ncbi:AGAP004876-PA-like protein [Anopheles sinensis]|uniref:chitinase n=1 Tax=Anopheles sinensis TaxID=74873 RepID=A0A084WJC2_ANOSI|nr:AGAP004876-PA-like protein [Anopheles sinensis]
MKLRLIVRGSFFGGTARDHAVDRFLFCRAQFQVEYINPHLCTHLLYTFFGVDDTGRVTVLDPWLDLDDFGGLGNIRRFNELRNINPNLKTLAVIGGETVDPVLFSTIAASPSLRTAFARNVREFCQLHRFDGADIDWEYPGLHEGDNVFFDKVNFVLMLSELARELHGHGLLLSAAVGASENIASIAYDIPGVAFHVDFINLMTYDYNGAWNDWTGHNAPLYAGPSDQNDFQQMLNVNHSVNYWISQGAPVAKLMLGVPAYGRSFTLANAAQNWLRAPAIGPGVEGPYTRQPGYLAYHEVCGNFLPGTGWTRIWESVQRIPYGFFGNQWIGYDDQESFAEKCRFLNTFNLGGAMLWTIDMDDFAGYCGANYGLLQVLNNCL